MKSLLEMPMTSRRTCGNTHRRWFVRKTPRGTTRRSIGRVPHDLGVAIGIAALWLGIAVSTARAQDAQILFTPDTEILENYETWSLFLVCSPTWAKPDAYERIQDLWSQFWGFGRAIGESHLAVWFWRQEPRWGTEQLVEDLDIERAAGFCETYGLMPSRSPHVLVTTTYPTVDERVEEYVVLELAGAGPDEIDKFLVDLADALFADDLASLDKTSEGFWFTLFEKIRGAIRGLGEGITVTVESGPLKLRWAGNSG